MTYQCVVDQSPVFTNYGDFLLCFLFPFVKLFHIQVDRLGAELVDWQSENLVVRMRRSD